MTECSVSNYGTNGTKVGKTRNKFDMVEQIQNKRDEVNMLSKADKTVLSIIVDVFTVGPTSFVVADRLSDLVFDVEGPDLEELFMAILESVTDDMRAFLLTKPLSDQCENIVEAIMDYDEMTEGRRLKKLADQQERLTATEALLWLELKRPKPRGS
jgi:hypothetical protein